MKAKNHVRYGISLCRWLVGATLAVGFLNAQAANWDRSTDFYWNVGNGNITAFPGQGSGNTWSQGTKAPLSSGPQWTGPAKQLPFNPSPTANFKAKFSPGKMAKAIVSPTAAIPLAAAPLLNYLINQACVRVAGGQMTLSPGGLWEECIMAEVPLPPTKRAFNPYKTPSAYNSRADACAPYDPGPHPGFPNDPNKFGCWTTANPATAPWAGYDIWQCSDGAGGWTPPSGWQDSNHSCGTQYVESGNYGPTSASNVEAKLTEKLTQWTQCDYLYGYGACAQFGNESSGAVLDQIITNGASVEADGVATPTVQSPILEPPVTVERTDPATGIKTTETTQTENVYDCLVISNGQAVQCSQYKKTTTITGTQSTPGGTVTTATTVVTNKTAEPASDPVDTCAKYPDTLGCANVDSPQVEVPKSTANVSFSADDLGLGAGSCPSPISVTAGGVTRTISYQAMCDLATNILRPVLLAAAAMMAYFIAAAGIKGD
jgi:hypothetical protein